MTPSTAGLAGSESGTSRWTRHARAVFLVIMYGLATWFALSEFIRWPGMQRSRSADPDAMIYGHADRPYVTRALVPFVLRALIAATPPAVSRAGGRLVLDVTEGDENLSWVKKWPYEFGLTVAILFLTLVAFAFVLRRLGAVTLGLTGMPRDFAPAMSLLVLPTQYSHMSHLYDYATLLLFAMGTLALAERRWWLYAIVFVLATINKETSILLAVAWMFLARGVFSRRRYVAALAAQVVLWVFIRAFLAWLFRSNPGSLVEWRLGANLAVLRDPLSYLWFRQLAGIPVVPFGVNIVFIAALVWEVRLLGRISPVLRVAFWTTIPLLVAGLTIGYVAELRAYLEFYTVSSLVLTYGLCHLLGYCPKCPSAPDVP